MICKECKREFDDASALSRHICTHNLSSKEYYDRHIKCHDDGICQTCGKATKYLGLTKGYSKHCSNRCANRDPESNKKRKTSLNAEIRKNAAIKSKETRMKLYGTYLPDASKEKIRATCIERYGGIGMASKKLCEKTKAKCIEKYGIENPASTDQVKEKISNTKLERYENSGYNNIEKIKDTCLKKYGVDCVFKSESIKEQIVCSNLENLGVRYPMMSKEVLEKSKKTCLDRYGAERYSLSEEYRGKLLEEFITDHDHFKEIQKREHNILKCKCHKCNKDFEINYQTFIRRSELCADLCPYCSNYSGRSAREHSVLKFILNHYDKTVIQNCRTVLKNKHELDIYLPEFNLAIEFDGLFWHSEVNKDKNYHLKKTEECIEKGIKLIHIFEDEWEFHRDIVESRLLAMLGKSDRIFARKCMVISLDTKEKRAFFEKNHIQGDARSNICYGLQYDDEIVAAMSFGKSRFSNELELVRYANKLNMSVIGGASKLLKHFIRENSNVKRIVSYADRRWSTGNMYEKLGFHMIEKTNPSYFYIVDGRRENRMKYQKHKLVESGENPAKSEHQIMLEKKIYRIYDCGCLKYEYII